MTRKKKRQTAGGKKGSRVWLHLHILIFEKNPGGSLNGVYHNI